MLFLFLSSLFVTAKIYFLGKHFESSKFLHWLHSHSAFSQMTSRWSLDAGDGKQFMEMSFPHST